MSSKIEIANLALTKVGTRLITSIDGKEEQAAVIRAVFDHTLKAELRSHAWSCAIKRVKLPALEDKSVFGQLYQYQLPVDCLRILKKPNEKIEVEGRKILTTINPPFYLRYIKHEKDFSQLDALFLDALACRLAVNICEKLSSSNTKKNILVEEYKASIREARKANAFEKYPDDLPVSDWLTARL